MKRRGEVSSREDKKRIYDLIQRDPGFIVWNDESYGRIVDRKSVNDAFKRAKVKIEDMVGKGRMDEVSGYDSISFISDSFRRVLELYYGTSSRGSSVFKPIISSNGKDHLFFGKTVFVYDPDMQASVFSKVRI